MTLPSAQMPQVEVVAPVAGDEQVELAVAVVVEPQGAVGVHPVGQAALFLRHGREMLAAVVVVQDRPAPFVNQHVLIAVVVVVAPDGAHADAGPFLIEVGEADFLGHVLERAVMLVVIEGALAALAAVDDEQIGPAVAVEIDHRNRRPHRGDDGQDVLELGVELRRPLMDEIDAARLGDLFQVEAVVAERGVPVEGRRRVRAVAVEDEGGAEEQCQNEEKADLFISGLHGHEPRFLREPLGDRYASRSLGRGWQRPRAG